MGDLELLIADIELEVDTLLKSGIYANYSQEEQEEERKTLVK